MGRSRRLRTLEEGLFYNDALRSRGPTGLATLQAYAGGREANVAPGARRKLALRPRLEFVHNVLWRSAYKARALVVGFSVPLTFHDSRSMSHRGEGSTAADSRSCSGVSRHEQRRAAR